MRVFRYLTAGESHGPALVGILDGLPAHLALDVEAINAALQARQGGYGRGARMKIESDAVEFMAGVRGGVTLGSPLAVLLRNRDYENVRNLMDPLTGSGPPLTQAATGSRGLCGRPEISPARSAQRTRTRQRARDGNARGARCDLRTVFVCAGNYDARRTFSRSGRSSRATYRTSIRIGSLRAKCAVPTRTAKLQCSLRSTPPRRPATRSGAPS